MYRPGFDPHDRECRKRAPSAVRGGHTVNTVSPGATYTELLDATNSPEGLALAARMTPLGRLSQPSDVADVVAFPAGPDGRWLTGQNLRATGGIG
jgi:3-oxoacyl-[acyl-carrier protein] reductase